VADRLTQGIETCGSNKEEQPMVSTWADDVTVIANSRLDACRAIRT